MDWTDEEEEKEEKSQKSESEEEKDKIEPKSESDEEESDKKITRILYHFFFILSSVYVVCLTAFFTTIYQSRPCLIRF